MNIALATSDQDILAAYPVMRELRPHITQEKFLQRVTTQEAAGYRLAICRNADRPVAVAGFRISENLAWGRHLYVDDLVTHPGQRSQGHGTALLNWLRDHAKAQGCGQLHLDSGMQRKDAHRFYEREGMVKASFHFSQRL